MKLAFALLLCAFFVSCPEEPPPSGPASLPALPEYMKNMQIGGDGIGTLALSNLSNNDVYVVKVNRSHSTALPSYLRMADNPESNEAAEAVGTITTDDGKTYTQYERRYSYSGNSRPAARSVGNTGLVRSVYSEATTVGATHNFWVDVDGNINTASLSSRQATLRYIGTYCKIWVLDANWSSVEETAVKVNFNRIKALGDKFDTIYPIETNLLGYEYGGGPGGNGGADADEKIQILVFDIDNDYADPSGNRILGYFWGKDELPKTIDPQSNEAEIFYVDAPILRQNENMIYSTLIHEFNHMINYNIKSLKNNTYSTPETWYTEFLSLCAEDVIGPMVGIGINNGNAHPAPRTLGYWKGHSDIAWVEWNTSVYAYPSAYAFGAYLMRNFGGARLLKEIAQSASGGKASIENALRLINSGVSMDYVALCFADALVFSTSGAPGGHYSFNKTASSTIGSYTYNFNGFTIDNFTNCSYQSHTHNFTTEPEIKPKSTVLPSWTACIVDKQTGVTGDYSSMITGANTQGGEYFVIVK